jgi:hypothetical protein
VQNWFKASGYEVRDGIIPVGAHEMWARGGERYFMEGRAPSTRLKRAFETFRSWLTALYKNAAAFRSPITPEIREVFDRLLATDAEIAEARAEQGVAALWNSAEEAGMSRDEFANYQEQVDAARADAAGRVLDRAMEHIRKRESRLTDQRRRDMLSQIEEEVSAEPLFSALAVMKTERLDRARLIEAFGDDVLDKLPVRVPPLFKDDGADPQVVAEMAGFRTAKEMIDALVAAQTQQAEAKASGDTRPLKRRVVEERLLARLNAEYGPPLSDEQMLGVSIGAGLFGGLVATLQQGQQLSIRELGLRSVASAMSAPAIVAVMLWQLELTPRLFGVVAVAGVAGLIAWPMAQMVPKMVPKLVREWLARMTSKDGQP